MLIVVSGHVTWPCQDAQATCHSTACVNGLADQPLDRRVSVGSIGCINERHFAQSSTTKTVRRDDISNDPMTDLGIDNLENSGQSSRIPSAGFFGLVPPSRNPSSMVRRKRLAAEEIRLGSRPNSSATFHWEPLRFMGLQHHERLKHCPATCQARIPTGAVDDVEVVDTSLEKPQAFPSQQSPQEWKIDFHISISLT